MTQPVDFTKFAEIEMMMVQRISNGKSRKRCVVYPDDRFRKVWDAIIAMYETIFILNISDRLIVITCMMTPYVLAFPEVYTREIMLFDNSMNLIFFIDVMICFFSAYHDEEYTIIDDHKVCFQL